LVESFFAFCWCVLISIHIKLCSQIKHNWGKWRLKIVTPTSEFDKKAFQVDYQASKHIIQRLGYFLFCLDFVCLTYVSICAVLLSVEIKNNNCTALCTPPQLFYIVYKIVLFFLCNWVAAEVTSAELDLLKEISQTIAFTSDMAEQKSLLSSTIPQKQRDLQQIHQFLTDVDRLGELGFTLCGVSLTPKLIKSMLGACASLVLFGVSLLAGIA